MSHCCSVRSKKSVIASASTTLLPAGWCHIDFSPVKNPPPLRCGLSSEFFDHLLVIGYHTDYRGDVSSRDVHGNGNPNGNGNPMGMGQKLNKQWEWESIRMGMGMTAISMGMDSHQRLRKIVVEYSNKCLILYLL